MHTQLLLMPVSHASWWGTCYVPGTTLSPEETKRHPSPKWTQLVEKISRRVTSFCATRLSGFSGSGSGPPNADPPTLHSREWGKRRGREGEAEQYT